MEKKGPFSHLVGQSYHLAVPRDPKRNLLFRKEIHRLCANDKEAREAIVEICRRDILFWINTFCWVDEPRGGYTLPFVTWPFQDELITGIVESVGVNDVGIEKTRDMGATWITMAIVTHFFQFQANAAIGCMSKTEDLAVNMASPKSLYFKVRYLLEHQPAWMRPAWEVKEGIIVCHDTGSTITGSSTTKDAARGDRYLFFVMDEFAAFNVQVSYDAWASTQFVTNTRIALSTPQGLAGMFAELMARKKGDRIKRFSLPWWVHPHKRRGLYTSEHGVLRIIDRDYDFPANYKFVLDGKTRSPYYDNQCERNPSKRHIAQEIDIDYGGAGSPFFDMSIITAHSQKYGSPFVRRYYVACDEDALECELIEKQDGQMLVWYSSEDRMPPKDQDYIIGCDVATGQGGDGSTNSVASIAGVRTGEKIAEFASDVITPERFAMLVIGLRKIFSGPTGIAHLIWEANGPGGVFGKIIMSKSPGRVYYRRQSERSRVRKITKEPGWWSSQNEKNLLLSEYQFAMHKSKFINHHVAALEECIHYVYGPSGSVIHDRAAATDDPTSAGENHGDRVIADAMVSRMLSQVGGSSMTASTASITPVYNASQALDPMTFGGRMQRKLTEDRKRAQLW